MSCILDHACNVVWPCCTDTAALTADCLWQTHTSICDKHATHNTTSYALVHTRRARRLADGRVVVVKEINTTSLSAKQKSATMDEVLVLAKLNHPNIVKYHDCYMDAVYINIVMEYCNAGDLAGLIKAREGRFMPEEEVMSLFVQVRHIPGWFGPWFIAQRVGHDRAHFQHA